MPLSMILTLCLVLGTNMTAVLAADEPVSHGQKTEGFQTEDVKKEDIKRLKPGDKIKVDSGKVFQVVLKGKTVFPSSTDKKEIIQGFQDEEKTKETGRIYSRNSYTLPAADKGNSWKVITVKNEDWFYDETGEKMQQGAYIMTLEQEPEQKVKSVDAVLEPVITVQPTDAEYEQNDTAQALSVEARLDGGGTLNYQWYQSSTNDITGGAPIAGAVSSSYKPGTDTVGTTYYYCAVTVEGTSAAVTSRMAVVKVNAPAPVDAQTPEITGHPENAAYIRDAGAEALNVAAQVTDGGTLSYQWYQNSTDDTVDGSPIPNATSAEYIPKTDVAGTVYYYCVVTNTKEDATGEKAKSAVSNVAEIIVTEPESVDAQTPQITKHPSDAAYEKAVKAEALSVEAVVTDGGILSYQWYQSVTNDTAAGTPITDALSVSYIPKTEAAGTTYYYCVVTNTKEDATGVKTKSAASTAAKIVVTETKITDAGAPVITENPKGASYLTGDDAKTLKVAAKSPDGGTLTYQWYSNTKESTLGGTSIKDAAKSTYTPSTKTAGTLYYYCEVTNRNEKVNGKKSAAAVSSTAKVVVSSKMNAEAPSVSGPGDASYDRGKAAKAMEVKASVKDGGTLSYQWYSISSNSNKGGSIIKGATKSTYTPSTASVGTTYYYCVVTNTNQTVNGEKTVSVASRAAKITVKASVPQRNTVRNISKTRNTLAANARTQDETVIMVWLVLLVISAAVVAVLAVKRRNK